jgi:hypothetical protein
MLLNKWHDTRPTQPADPALLCVVKTRGLELSKMPPIASIENEFPSQFHFAAIIKADR